MKNTDWIKVEDRLPLDHEYVLVYKPNGVQIAECVNRNPILFDSPDWFGATKSVTHWMPLPEPPKTDK